VTSPEPHPDAEGSADTPCPPQRSWRWREPRSLAGAVALFVVGYLLWQPFAVGALLPLVGERSFVSWALWRVFLEFVVLLGALSGALWWWGGKRPAGWLRYCLRSTGRLLALVTTLEGPRLTTMSAGEWLGLTLFTAVMTGAIFSPLERWNEARTLRPPAA
jgi:hypothetical protein